MSLFGALSSGVSGLTAQSSAMGAISDNITNVNTIGYKNTRVDFQTLVTKQTSSTLFSPGGVQSAPRQDTGVQGLLQSSTSATDIAISGNGYFVVNQAPRPGIADTFLFSRAGSFFQDNEGFLRNTSGFYLQAWPTDAGGKVRPANKNLTIANQNILSTDFLETINLNNVGGTATATANISIGANLPANDAAGTTHRTDVQFFDSLGNPSNASFVYTKADIENQWSIDVAPPQGTSVLTLEDATATTPKVYGSVGQLEFNVTNAAGDGTRRPADGSTVVIDGITYEFDDQPATITAGTSSTTDFAITTTQVSSIAGTFSKVRVGDVLQLVDAETAADIGKFLTVTAVNADGSDFTYTNTGGAITANTADTAAQLLLFNKGTGETTGTTARKRVDISSSTSLAGDVAALVAAVKKNDADYADDTNASTGGSTITTARISISPASSTTILFEDDGRSKINVDPTGLLDSSGSLVTVQKSAFEVKRRNDDYTDEVFLQFNGTQPADGDTATVNGIVYEFDSNSTISTGNKTVTIGSTVAATLQALVDAVEANDPSFAPNGTRIRLTTSNTDSAQTAVATSISGSVDVGVPGTTDLTTLAGIANADSFSISHNGVAAVTFAIATGNTLNTLIAAINASAIGTGGGGGVVASAGTGDNLVLTAADGRAIQVNNVVNTPLSSTGLGITTGVTRGTIATTNAVTSTTLDTLVLKTLPNNPASNNNATNIAGVYSISFSDSFASTVTTPNKDSGDRTTIASPTTGSTAVTVQTKAGLKFSADGLPTEINVKDVEILGFASGANDMDDAPTGVGNLKSEKIEMNFGTLLEANGFTQFGAEFTPVFIQQNGSRFGNFAGVTVNGKGQVVALFDNGETRNIYQIPIATFVNVNQLESRTGNVWTATEASGDATLREANTGPAGETIQSSLEASTVDIGEEFTKMIIVQRAFSASAKIISTADDMLEELLRTKR